MPGSLQDLPDDCLVSRLPQGSTLVRVHDVDKGPVWFGPAPGNPPANRFDAPAAEFRALYAAEGLPGGFVERILHRGRRIIGRPFLEQHAWSELRLNRDLDVAQLHGPGLAYHRVTNDISAGTDYAETQALSRAMHAKYAIDGLAYRSRHNNDEVCFALYDRIGACLEVVATYRFADNMPVIEDLIRRHGAAIDPMRPLPSLTALP